LKEQLQLLEQGQEQEQEQDTEQDIEQDIEQDQDMDQDEMNNWVEREGGEYSNMDDDDDEEEEEEEEEEVYAIRRQVGYTIIGPNAWRERKAAKEVARIQKLRDRAKRKAKAAYRRAKEEELHQQSKGDSQVCTRCLCTREVSNFGRFKTCLSCRVRFSPLIKYYI
jgi:hypothetical protein